MAATNLTDWPDTIVRLDVQYVKGMFRCEENTYFKPTSTSVSTIRISQRDATLDELLYFGA